MIFGKNLTIIHINVHKPTFKCNLYKTNNCVRPDVTFEKIFVEVKKTKTMQNHTIQLKLYVSPSLI